MKLLSTIVSTLACFAFSSCAIVPFPHASADAYQFSGRICDQRTKLPVQGAKIVLTGLPATTTHSDAGGYFLTRPSHTLHLLGIYSYDAAIVWQLPPPRSAAGPLQVSHPNYKTRGVTVNSDRRYEPFAEKPAPIDLKDIFIQRLSK